MQKNGLIRAAILVSVLICGTASAASTVILGSGVLTSDSQIYSATGIHALNGNMDTEGYLGLMNYTYREFSYDADIAGVSTNIRNIISSGHVMIGYQKFFNDMNLAAFIGPDYVSDTNTPTDPNRANVNAYGVRAQVYLRRDFSGHAEFTFKGAYSTADSTYELESEYLYGVIPSINIGPQVSLAGSKSYNEERYGLLLTTGLSKDLHIGLGAGFATNRLTDDTPYISLSLEQRL